eukprot:66585-Pyramimonas_sp.AAC.1
MREPHKPQGLGDEKRGPRRCDIIITPPALPSSKRRAGVPLSSHHPLWDPWSTRAGSQRVPARRRTPYILGPRTLPGITSDGPGNPAGSSWTA